MTVKTPDGPSIYKDCGTSAAHGRHGREGTPRCRRCKKWKNAQMMAYRHNKGLSKARLIPDTVIQKHGIKVGA